MHSVTIVNFNVTGNTTWAIGVFLTVEGEDGNFTMGSFKVLNASGSEAEFLQTRNSFYWKGE